MKYKLISYEHKKGTFVADNKNIEYNNYKLYFTRPALENEIRAGNYSTAVVIIKARASEIFHIAKTPDELAKCVGRDFIVESEVTENGVKTYFALA